MAVKHTFKGPKGLITKILTPIKAIREKCKDCSVWQDREINGCLVTDCALYPFRMGKIPERKGKGVSGEVLKARFSRRAIAAVGDKQKTHPTPSVGMGQGEIGV